MIATGAAEPRSGSGCLTGVCLDVFEDGPGTGRIRATVDFQARLTRWPSTNRPGLSPAATMRACATEYAPAITTTRHSPSCL